jgi:hypothetical protein
MGWYDGRLGASGRNIKEEAFFQLNLGRGKMKKEGFVVDGVCFGMRREE